MIKSVHTGKLRQWNKDKGFGLIGREKGERDIFIHASELKDLSRKPKVGDTISYRVITSKGGNIQAVNGFIKGVSAPPFPIKVNNGTKKLLTFVVVFILVVAVVSGIKQFI